jgi:hypothetical protein
MQTIVSAGTAICFVVISSLNAQPITFRSNKPSTIVRYHQPSVVCRYVMSDTYFYLVSIAPNSQFRIFSQTGKPWFDWVVGINHHHLLVFKPYFGLPYR